MTPIGRHLTTDMYGCNRDHLTDLEFVKSAMLTSIKEAGLSVIDIIDHQTEPQGLTIIALLGQSHMSIHTFPQLNYAAVDIFTCGDYSHSDRVITILKRFLKPEKTRTTNIMRGDFGLQKDMKPRIRVSIAPLRRMRNTSARVWRFLRNR
ncbi:adenosylmethionine decarboxylase [Sporomusa acidovorans]|uniref:S-adenosylmethionine decarboxylase proenzyme n=1 Tax=Sporomusa acidovorans (strain ATCC 49682 / DSM 3132 / Mol) TaxID=1123286 RepID=A0ABZ3IX08_SPOA4|nr:adenosylmethionine decarboxylase [Sporomusa acidovorans]OZC13864.1 S-adenosylmethionine decarboxylase proenzyme precursor [Sporomusa acidovorans DSM 3132]SDF48368.1 S-adenosylmethionine decarboxylase [Sporomusa acidovorans]